MLLLETALPLRERLLSTAFSHTFVLRHIGYLKISTNQCTMFPKTPNPELETSFETLVVK